MATPCLLQRFFRSTFRVLRLALGTGAIVIISGLSLDVAQFIAWGVMLRDNLESRSVSESIINTFEKEARCSLCLAIEDARQQDQEQQPSAWVAKSPLLLIAFQQIGWVTVFRPSSYLIWSHGPLNSVSQRPLLPPPRND
jgi:hypothetical protein